MVLFLQVDTVMLRRSIPLQLSELSHVPLKPLFLIIIQKVLRLGEDAFIAEIGDFTDTIVIKTLLFGSHSLIRVSLSVDFNELLTHVL